MRWPRARCWRTCPASTRCRATRGTEDLLFRVSKNLFETLAFVAHKTEYASTYVAG